MVNPRLPPDVVEALESLMERAKLTRSGAIREALKAWVRWLDAQPRKWAR